MKLLESFKKAKEKCRGAISKLRPVLDYVGKRKKRFIFGGIGCVILFAILCSVISGVLAQKRREATFDRVFKYGADDLSYNQNWAVYQCKDDDEAEAVVWWIFFSEFGETEETFKKIKTAFAKAVMNKNGWEEKDLKKWYANFLFYNHVNAVEQSYYIVHLKDEGACLWWEIKHDRSLVRKYGKTFKSISFKKTKYAVIPLY